MHMNFYGFQITNQNIMLYFDCFHIIIIDALLV
jgi:hypothetical protein